MFFLGFVFAYFYLRSLDNNHLWRPAGVDPPSGYGIAIAAAFALSAVAFGYAARAARSGRGVGCAASGVALALGLFGCVAAVLRVRPRLLRPRKRRLRQRLLRLDGALHRRRAARRIYRVETVFASGLRNRGAPPPEGFVPGAYYWALLAAIGVLAWIVLYLV